MPRVLPILLTLLANACAFCANYSGGNGSCTDPYLISSGADLGTLSANPADWGMCFVLTSDISADSYVPVSVFTGTFDGGGHSISGFACVSGTSYVGFFGKVQGSSACVKNLHLSAPVINVSGADYVGAVAGSVLSGATVQGCLVTGGSVTGHNQTGGIAGSNAGGKIVDCNSSAAVSGNSYVGGVAGRNEQSSEIRACVAMWTVSAGTDYCGGLVGLNLGTVSCSRAVGQVVGTRYTGGLVGGNGDTTAAGAIYTSLAEGAVRGTSYVGGLVGCNLKGAVEDCYASGSVVPTSAEGGGLVGRNGAYGTIARCYSKGNVGASGGTFGGLVGKNLNSSSAIGASFWDMTISGQANSAGGTGLSTDQMKQRATFTGAGWGFLGEVNNGSAERWRMCVTGLDYPRLAWEWPAADLACGDGIDFVDFASLAMSWQQAGQSLNADFDSSGIVDGGDLLVLVAGWLH